MALMDIPKMVNRIASDIPALNALLKAIVKQDVSAYSDAPNGAIKSEVDVQNRLTIKRKDGSSWTTIAKLMHDVDRVDGYDASMTRNANTIPVRDSNGKIKADLEGNADTATTASALANTLSVSKGGTGGTTPEAARRNLSVPSTQELTDHKGDADAHQAMLDKYVRAYGLGAVILAEKCTIQDANEARKVGWYFLSSTAENSPSKSHYVLTVTNYHERWIQQVAQSIYGNRYLRIGGETEGVLTWGKWKALPSAITDDPNGTSTTTALSQKGGKAIMDKATTKATTKIAGIVRIATAEEVKSGTTGDNGPAFVTPETYKNNMPPAPVPLMYNTKEVITSSKTWTAPVDGWYKVTCIGGGGAGGAGGGESIAGVGGNSGGSTKFATIQAYGGGGGGGGSKFGNGGGGGAGKIIFGFVYLSSNQAIACTIGAGGAGSASQTSTDSQTAGKGNGGGGAVIGVSANGICGAGACGACNGASAGERGSFGTGGTGGTNYSGYGGGGGGGCQSWSIGEGNGGNATDGAEVGGSLSSEGSRGGSGGNGAIIIEYFNPTKVGA